MARGPRSRSRLGSSRRRCCRAKGSRPCSLPLRPDGSRPSNNSRPNRRSRIDRRQDRLDRDRRSLRSSGCLNKASPSRTCTSPLLRRRSRTVNRPSRLPSPNRSRFPTRGSLRRLPPRRPRSAPASLGPSPRRPCTTTRFTPASWPSTSSATSLVPEGLASSSRHCAGRTGGYARSNLFTRTRSRNAPGSKTSTGGMPTMLEGYRGPATAPRGFRSRLWAPFLSSILQVS